LSSSAEEHCCESFLFISPYHDDLPPRAAHLGGRGNPGQEQQLRSCLEQLVKTRQDIPRGEVPVRLHISLKLRGKNSQGTVFEETATTEDVCLSGFLCGCTAELAIDSVVEVYLTSHEKDCVGKARIVHSNSEDAPLRHYKCRFIERTGPWVLQ